MRKQICVALISSVCCWPASAHDTAPDVHLLLREVNYHETVLAGSATDQGAIRVGMGELYDETVTKRVGSMLMTCANTEAENGVVKSSYCSGVMRLEDGVLAWSAASGLETEKSKVHNLIFTGGSGAYANMRGYGYNKFSVHPSYQEIFLFRQH